MGFFAGELEQVLFAHAQVQGSPWSILARLSIHPQQIDRLKKAADDITQVATLPDVALQQLRHELELTPAEWSRLQAGAEADASMRMLMYHSYPLDEAVNHANAIFAASFKDRLITNGGDRISIHLSDGQAGSSAPRARRSRRPVNDVSDGQADLQQQIANQALGLDEEAEDD